MQKSDHAVRDCDTFQRKTSRQEENTVVPSSVAKKVIGMAGKLKIKDLTKNKGFDCCMFVDEIQPGLSFQHEEI